MSRYSFDVTVGSSPILYQDTVILLCAMANAGDSNVVAFDKANGEVKWRQKFPDMAFGHSTPVIISVKEKPQMLVLASGMSETGNALRSLDPASGKPLWWCRGAGDAASPAFGAGIVYFDSGRGGKGVAVDPGGSRRRLRNPYPLDRARHTRGDQFTRHRRSLRVSPAQTGRGGVLGSLDGQEGLARAAARHLDDLGQSRRGRRRPSLFRQRRKELRDPVRPGIPHPGRQRPRRRQPSLARRRPRPAVSRRPEERLLHRR